MHLRVESTVKFRIAEYFYFIDEYLGLCYLRVPTWSLFRLQFYFNGHNWLASQLTQGGIGYELQDKAFLQIDDFEIGNQLAAQLNIVQLHPKLDSFARRDCRAIDEMNMCYNWSIMQAEYATDLVFKQQQILQAYYPRLLETLIQAVKPVDIATFLGHKLHGNYQ